MINILRKCGLCSQVENLITREKVETVGSVYVDDANMYSGGNIGSTVEEVVEARSKQGHAWASLLKISGGCAKAKKSFWYLMQQVCENGTWSWGRTEGTEMVVPIDDGLTHTFKSLPTSEAQTRICGNHWRSVTGKKRM